MKIVSWNCGGAFYTQEKYKKIRELDADIYVICEINNPQETDEDYNEFMKNHYYLEQKYDVEEKTARAKGIAVIAKEGIELEENDWEIRNCQDFLSVKIKDSLNLVAVWTHGKYLEPLIKYLRINEENFKNSENLVMCGDFNLDLALDNMKNKDSFIKILESYGYESIYHKEFDEEFGKESVKTFHRFDGDFHIDYLFTKPELVTSFELGSKEEYVDCDGASSDHVPLIFEIDLE